MRFVAAALALMLVFAACAALAQENQTNQSNQTNETNQTPTPTPAASPSAAPVTGQVVLLTNPADGDIFIDGAKVGTGFYVNSSFPAGFYRVSFGEIPGYRKPANITLEVVGGKETRRTVSYEAAATPPPTIPKLAVTKEVAKPSASVAETIEVVITVTNGGNGRATNASYGDALNDCFERAAGALEWRGELDPEERVRNVYSIKPTREDLCFLDPTKVVYFDSAGNRYSALSGDVKILVTGRKEEAPKIDLRKVVSKSDPFVGDDVTVTLTLKNTGTAPALGVVVSDEIPGCAQITGGTPGWNGTLAVNKEEQVTYTLSVKDAGICRLGSATVQYQDSRGGKYTADSSPASLTSKTKSFVEAYKDLISVVAVTGGAIGAIVTITNLARKAKTKVSEKKKKE
jgi:uncharacterized repeat protein (TIGR01451 family)